LRIQLGVVVAPSVVESLKFSLASALGRTKGRSEVVLARTSTVVTSSKSTSMPIS